MFGSKSKTRIKLERVVPREPRQSGTPSHSIPVLRPRGENRRGLRKDLWCVCSVETKGGEKREGVIIDISKSGARVRFRSRGTLPNVVRIKASRIGLKRFARVIWQSAFDAGLEFVPNAKIENASR